MMAELLDRLDAVVSELASADLNPLSDDEILDVLRRLETVKRRLAPVDHRVLNSAAERGLPATLRCRSLPALLTELLRIDPAEAKARVGAAESFGSRLVWSGGRVGPRFPDTAAALADGVISRAHALVIAHAVDALPDSLVGEHGDFVEKTLLGHSLDEPPYWVAKLGNDLVGLLDQDGRLRDEAERERRREFRVTPRPDGSSRVTGELTAECTEALLTALESLTRPTDTPDAPDGTPDPRTTGQRNHDALLTLCLAAMRARPLPNVGGVACTMMLTMDADAWMTGPAPRTPDTATPCRRSRRSAGPAQTPGSSSPCSARRRTSSPTPRHTGSTPSSSDWRSSPATGVAPCPAATPHPPSAKSIMSPNGARPAGPASTTERSPAPTTTATARTTAGPSP